MQTTQLISRLDDLLAISEFKDYGPNGLQVEGNEKVSRVALAVSATEESIQQAVEWGAELLVVHHGLLWKFHGVRPLVGPIYRRFEKLISQKINLAGYHLPLDAHIPYGNAAQIALQLGADVSSLQHFGFKNGSPCGVVYQNKDPELEDENQLVQKLKDLFNRDDIRCSNPVNRNIKTIAIATGSAADFLYSSEHIDCLITGEFSEHHWHDANERQILLIAGGHHRTETFGVLGLQQWLGQEFPSLQTRFFDSYNPV